MRIYFHIRYAAVLFAVLTACSVSEKDISPLEQPQLPENLETIRDGIDQIILETISETGQPFNWNEADNDVLFDALRVSEHGLAVGYSGGADQRNALLELIQAAEGTEDVLLYEDDILQFFGVKIEKPSTLELIRSDSRVEWIEISNYPFNIDLLSSPEGPLQRDDLSVSESRREMVLDPQQSDPSYVDQVAAFDGSLRTVMRRHNMETVYTDRGLFGDGINVAILDNGLLPERTDFFLDNGYGDRYREGYYNPWFFLPFTQPDGTQPRPTDVFGLSILIYDTYYIHGSEMSKMVLTLAPNANIHSVRGSTWTVILFIDQIMGICDAIKAQADNPDIRVSSMSMGTIFYFNRIASAIEYYDSKGKIFIASAGSTFEGVSDLLGVLFPGIMPETVTTTGIKNRETTGGAFELPGGTHGGPENDFTVENTNSSSVAASRAAGMTSLIWSANPELTREELLSVLVESSYFFQESGAKDPLFGWGTIDVGHAVELAVGE